MLTLNTIKDTKSNQKKMLKRKLIKVNVGTGIVMVSPSHPLSVAVQIKRIVDRILTLDDKEYEYSCNTIEGLAVFEFYGAERHPELSVQYFLNGSKVSYEKAVEDLRSGVEYVEELIGKKI